ncbi:MAG: hypothetical protein MRK00_03795 [Nitrosomonas sp.]|nr:hypothetical protein [Nitrosomonas sp.]
MQITDFAPEAAAMTVFVNQANSQAFDSIGYLEHDRQTNYHGWNTKWPRQREQYDSNDKNDRSDAHQHSAFDHPGIVLFENVSKLGNL